MDNIVIPQIILLTVYAGFTCPARCLFVYYYCQERIAAKQIKKFNKLGVKYSQYLCFINKNRLFSRLVKYYYSGHAFHVEDDYIPTDNRIRSAIDEHFIMLSYAKLLQKCEHNRASCQDYLDKWDYYSLRQNQGKEYIEIIMWIDFLLFLAYLPFITIFVLTIFNME